MNEDAVTLAMIILASFYQVAKLLSPDSGSQP